MKKQFVPASILAALLTLPALAMAAPAPTAHHAQAAMDDQADAQADDEDNYQADDQSDDQSADDQSDDQEADDESNSDDANMASAPASQSAQATMTQQNGDSSYRPLIQGEANTGNITPAQLAAQPAPITLQEKKKDRRGELMATQPGEVQLQENRHFTPHQ